MTKNKSRPMAMLGAVMLLASSSRAQSLAPQAASSTGIKMTRNNSSVCFTVGELVVKSQTDANGNTLGSGSTNAATVSTTALSVNTSAKEVLNASVHPNPTTSLLTAEVASTNLSLLVIELTDLQGKTVSSNH